MTILTRRNWCGGCGGGGGRPAGTSRPRRVGRGGGVDPLLGRGVGLTPELRGDMGVGGGGGGGVEGGVAPVVLVELLQHYL